MARFPRRELNFLREPASLQKIKHRRVLHQGRNVDSSPEFLKHKARNT